MDRFLTKVTVTGADDSTSIEQMLRLAAKYSFVEFGILFSQSRFGTPRFPSRKWINELAKSEGLCLAGHLCGSFVKDFLKGKKIFNELRVIYPQIGRWQINTHGIIHEYDLAGLDQNVLNLSIAGKAVIFQYDATNTEMIQSFCGQGSLNIQALYDLSHGAGIKPDAWPSLDLLIPVGYAGGLSPENLAAEIPGIYAAAKGKHTWIDAETRLRSPDDRIFDLALVEQFLAAAAPYVVKENCR